MIENQAQSKLDWSKIATRIGVNFILLAALGLVLALGLVWGFSSFFGQGLSHYPWHVVLWIDLLFILIAAVLSAIAEDPSDSQAQSLSLASFVIAVGTLGSLGTHAGKVWRSIEAGWKELDDPTILSEMLKVHLGQTDGLLVYLILTVAIIIIALVLACSSAFALRNSSRGYWVFIVSAFLFALYTIFNQRWDVSGPELAPFDRWQFLSLGVGATILLASLFLAVEFANATADAVGSVSRHFSADRPPSARERRTSRTEPLDGVRAAVSLLSAIPRWAWLIAVVVLIWSLPTMEQSFPPDIAPRVVSMIGWFAYMALVILAFSLLPDIVNVLTEVKVFLRRKLIDPLVGMFRWVFSGGRNTEVNTTPEEDERSRKDPDTKEDQDTRNGRDKQLPPISWSMPWWDRLKTRFQEHVWPLLKPVPIYRLKAASLAVSAVLVVLVLDCVFNLPTPYQPAVEWSGGRQALSPVGDTAGRSRMPPLRFWQAKVKCTITDPPAWALFKADALHASAGSCKPAEEIPCLPATIVVAGSASAESSPDDEMKRVRDRELARNRGKNLARILEGDFRERCGKNARVQSYVLNLGRYARGSLDKIGQRELVVLLSRGDEDHVTTANVLEAYTAAEARFAEYSSCDFYLWSSRDVNFVRKLTCGKVSSR